MPWQIENLALTFCLLEIRFFDVFDVRSCDLSLADSSWVTFGRKIGRGADMETRRETRRETDRAGSRIWAFPLILSLPAG